jgi:hypothetical protein
MKAHIAHIAPPMEAIAAIATEDSGKLTRTRNKYIFKGLAVIPVQKTAKEVQL